MIHKHYHPNGKPNLRRWILECDICQRRHPLFGSIEWLVPVRQGMSIYCPPCFNAWADQLIASALRCPHCNYTHLDLHIGDPGSPNPNHIDCIRCGAVLLTEDFNPPF